MQVQNALTVLAERSGDRAFTASCKAWKVQISGFRVVNPKRCRRFALPPQSISIMVQSRGEYASATSPSFDLDGSGAHSVVDRHLLAHL
jgi:hypothetical protein